MNFAAAQARAGVLGLMTLGFMTAIAVQAAPADDLIVPNGTWSGPCEAGMGINTICATDNSSVSYYMDSAGALELEAPDREVVAKVMSRYDTKTDLAVSYDATPVFSGVGETDVVWQEGAFGRPDWVLGTTWCDDPVDGTRHRCDQHYIRIRGAGTYSQRVAGHEAGHAFGLFHGPQADPVRAFDAGVMGIMRAPLDAIPGPGLGETVKNNINWVY
ncbi:hypothetical protein [Nocardioides daejeonensis]|uniref:hypothetical protein n=1 Tax=Nocardioides daejeonensis TaxID=1046556 RepID=UPI0013A54ED2|nr:hypothetical protein [Nocardioides daejeonensis]